MPGTSARSLWCQCLLHLQRGFLWTLVSAALVTTGFSQDSISVSVTGGSVAWNPLLPGSATNAGVPAPTISSSWSLQPGRTNVTLYVYFSNPAAALIHSSP